MADSGFLNGLGLATPIVQAPMGGGPSTPALVAAVSNAGGLGSLGAAYIAPALLAETIAATRALTDGPIAVNLFSGGYGDAARHVDPRSMLDILAAIHRDLGLEPPAVPALAPDPFAAQLEVILDLRPAVFSFTFGIPSAADLARLRSAGIRTIGTATTVEEAQRLAAAGVDAILAQGGEAGGHRGTFAGPFEAALVPVRELVAGIVHSVGLPIIGAGGLMDGRDAAEVLALGAAGAAFGTAFLASPESGVSDAQRRAVLAAEGAATLVTRAFSGRPARALANVFTGLIGGRDDILLPYPLQNSFTRPMRVAAAAAGLPGYLSMYAGTGVWRARAVPAGELVQEIADDVAVRGRR